MAVETSKRPAASTLRKPAPQYRVILHNDDFNSMEHVVESLLKVVPSLSLPQAVDIMMQAHAAGKAVVIICALEHAEFYCEGLQSLGLTCSIEPEE